LKRSGTKSSLTHLEMIDVLLNVDAQRVGRRRLRRTGEKKGRGDEQPHRRGL
jgi:hypothetical protein